jgi:hypothetical protein
VKNEKQETKMKTKNILWLILGIALAVIAIVMIHDLNNKPADEPIQRGVMSYEYHWLPGDSSQAVTTVKPLRKTAVSNGSREYEITAQNDAFTVRLSVLGREVESARILEARFQGQTQVTVYRDRIVTGPGTANLAVRYQAEVPAADPREKWVEVQIIMGALLVPPHRPILAGGVGIRRLPLIGKLPLVTLGAGWFGTAPGVFVEFRF